MEREGLPGSEPGLAKACAELRSAAGLGGPRRALGRSPSQRLRPELAIQDMHAALGEEGAAQSLAALRGMHRHILELMRGSPGDRDVDAVSGRAGVEGEGFRGTEPCDPGIWGQQGAHSGTQQYGVHPALSPCQAGTSPCHFLIPVPLTPFPLAPVQAVECAAAMREAASQHFQPDAWNSFLKDARKG